MIAYKFRSAAQAQFAFDILLNQRLFCAPLSSLNDPLEGVFGIVSSAGAPSSDNHFRDIRAAMKSYRICSLSADFQSHLLWAHYAGGFDGMAIEVELPDADPLIQRVSYCGVFGMLRASEIADPDQSAREVLFSKYGEWSYEREVRVLTDQTHYLLPRSVRRIVVGHRMNLALQEALFLVCQRQGIGFFRVGIGDEGLDADTVRADEFEARRRGGH